MQEQPCPDLIIEHCPVGCTRCAGIYVNMQTGHRIVCKCSCHCHYKCNNENAKTIKENEKNSTKPELQGALLVGSPERPAVQDSSDNNVNDHPAKEVAKAVNE